MLHKAQIAARNAARGKHGFGYIMEQGLGKTLTYEDEFLELVANEEATRSVVVAPNSFKQGWVKEIEKWNLNISPHVLDAKGAEYWTNRFIDSAHHKPPQIIVNYEAIRSSKIRELLSRFIDGRAASIAFDESIQISAHDAAQTKAAIELAKQFQHRRILSGKWMRTGPHNFWPQLRAIGALDGFNFYAWRNRFCKMGGFKGKQVVGIRPGTEERLAEIIRPWIFEAKKKDWTDLPLKTYTIRNYTLGSELQSDYDSMMEEFMVFLNEKENVSVDAAITKYIKLAQIQCGFILDEQGQARQLISDQHNPRLDALLTFMIDELTGKIAIPYQHRYSYELLSRALARWQPAYIAGGMSGADIELQKAKFNNDDSCRVILLQTKSSKYGHTLLGRQDDDFHACTTMAFFENTYDTDDREQIEDRIHRIGQRGTCNYVDFVGTDIDEKMIVALQERKDLYEAIMAHVSSIFADNQQSA